MLEEFTGAICLDLLLDRGIICADLRKRQIRSLHEDDGTVAILLAAVAVLLV